MNVMVQEYGIIAWVASEQDSGPCVMEKEGEPRLFESIDDAVKMIEIHSKTPLLIKDWIYQIVPLNRYGGYGDPVATYISMPELHHKFP